MKFFFSVFAGLRVWFCERGWRCVVSVCGCYVCLSRGIFGRLRVRFFCWAQARSTCIQAYGMVCLHCKCTCSLDPRDVHITSVLFSYSRTKCFNHSARQSLSTHIPKIFSVPPLQIISFLSPLAPRLHNPPHHLQPLPHTLLQPLHLPPRSPH